MQAQDLFIYPAEGQSEEQQSRDRFECHSWAVASQALIHPVRRKPRPGLFELPVAV